MSDTLKETASTVS